MSSNDGTNNQIRNAAKQELIQKHIKSPQGRQKLAASMIQPLRTRRDYSSVGRKTFLVEQLPDGALPIYDKDPDVTAYVVGEEGENILAVTKPRRVIFPLFEIASNPTIPLTQVKERRFDLIERSQTLAKSEIQAAEDERTFAVLDSIAVNGFDSLSGQTNPDEQVVAPINSSVLADAFAKIERHDLRVARVYMNAKDYADIRKFGREILDIESQATLLKTGLQGTLWGAQIIVSRLVPEGFVYVCCDPEMFGRIPVRTELTVLSADKPSERQIGFSVFENLGIGAFNPRGLTRMVVQR
jgi:HK97 family phage major capsid protein